MRRLRERDCLGFDLLAFAGTDADASGVLDMEVYLYGEEGMRKSDGRSRRCSVTASSALRKRSALGFDPEIDELDLRAEVDEGRGLHPWPHSHRAGAGQRERHSDAPRGLGQGRLPQMSRIDELADHHSGERMSSAKWVTGPIGTPATGPCRGSAARRTPRGEKLRPPRSSATARAARTKRAGPRVAGERWTLERITRSGTAR